MKRNMLIATFILLTYPASLLWAQEAQVNDSQVTGRPLAGTDSLAPPPAPAPGGNWWEILGYEKLNALIELALAENNELAIAQSHVEESKARMKLATSSLYPSLSFNPTFTRQEFSANRPMALEPPAGRLRNNTYALPLDLAYEVDIFGKIKSKVKASEFNLQASSAWQQASKLDIASAVAKNFIFLITLDVEEKVLKRTLDARKENLEIIFTRYQAGLTNEIDLQRAKTELSSVSVQLKNIQIQRREVELMLATLCGQPAGSFAIAPLDIKYFAPVIPLPGTDSLLQRPDLQAAGYSVEAYKKQLKNARKNLYPSLYITGSTGLLAGESDHIFENDSRNWLIGATLSVPLFEGGRRKAQMAISEQQLQRSISRLSQEKLIARQEVEREKSALVRLNEQLKAQQEFVAAARSAAELSHQRYRNGLVTYLEVVDAERIVLEAERLSAQLRGQQLLSTVELIVAMGGEI